MLLGGSQPSGSSSFRCSGCFSGGFSIYLPTSGSLWVPEDSGFLVGSVRVRIQLMSHL